MLYRKISSYIEDYLISNNDKILVVQGARQVGKSYIIREIGKKIYPNFIEINFVDDDEGPGLFKNVHTTEDFYLTLSIVAGLQLDNESNTLVFIDEIQHYPQFLTMLKFLRQEHRYRYIASGSMLGIALKQTTSVPVGSITLKEMYQLDFEEFLIANGVGRDAIGHIRNCFEQRQSLSEDMHNYILGLFRRYLVVGGMPDAVNTYLETHNIAKVRKVQNDIHLLYKADASKYEENASRKLMIRRIYDMIPSQMENKKKRIVAKNIQGIEGDRYKRYQEEFEYLISSGISLAVHAVSNPRYPLSESVQKNLLKLYLNDIGLLSGQLYGNNISPVLNDQLGVNLGAVYENVVAQELKSHGYKLFYYDNRSKGEVDYLVSNPQTTGIIPIEVKSGKDYTVHSALNNLLSIPDYGINSAFVMSNERTIALKDKITYMPIYYIMFFQAVAELPEEELYF